MLLRLNLAWLPGMTVAALPPVRIDAAGTGFVTGEPAQVFRPWGLNYGNAGRLIEDFWDKE